MTFASRIARVLTLLTLAGAACSSPSAPVPTPDAFAGVAAQSAQDYQQGQDLYAQGRVREALEAFRQAQLLSPVDDPQINAMVQRTSAELTPSPTPVPPTEVPANTATPSPLAQAVATPTLVGVTASAPPPSQPTPVPAPPPQPTAVPARPPTPLVTAVPPRVVAPSAPDTAANVSHATSFTVQSGAVAVAVDSTSSNVFVAAASGAIWTLAQGQPSARTPLAVSGQPVGLAVDSATGHLLVTQRGPAALTVLDIPTGQTLASVPLPADPGDLRFDADLQRAFVVLPDQNGLATLDTRDPHVIQVTSDLAQVTGITLDPSTHRLYLSHLDGQLSTLDATSGQPIARERLSGAGLSGVSTINGQVYAVNAPGQELLIYDPAAPSLKHVPLDSEPAAVVTGSTVSVLEPATGAVVELDLMGTVNHVRAQLDGEPLASVPLSPDTLWRRPRMAISPTDGTVYVVDPGSGALAVSPADT
jgi:hypothetical protein